MMLDMVKAGSGYELASYIILKEGVPLGLCADVTDRVDLALLPKSIGGEAVVVDENGEEDESCCSAFAHSPGWRELRDSL